MNSRERLLAAIDGQPPDHVPLTTWCFGFRAPEHLRWNTDGREVRYWYTKRLEHIHTLPQPWELEDEFKRAKTWLSLGIDDVVDVSVPWARDPEVKFRDETIPARASGGDERYPIMVREYETPSGRLRHSVKKTGDEGEGWPVQPNVASLIEDYNVPRATKHAVSSPSDVPAIRHLFTPPDEEQRRWFADRVATMRSFAEEQGLMTQAWSAFGMDAAVWFAGTEGSIVMSMETPETFSELMDIVAETDYARTELAANTEGIDMICQRGWYSSTDFWSPALFDQFVYPRLWELTALVHRHGKKFAYVMTTGVETLGPRLADAGVDLLYFIDPIQDSITLQKARELFGDRMTMAGGINSLTLASGDNGRIRDAVREAIDVLGPTNRFVLHPVDSIFPDTPWEGVEQMIQAWKEYI
jgi:uroporphyrinogen-III decarboxylase